MPNESLTLEWFYMTFHKSERDQFVISGRRLVDKTIESITEYFESLYNIKKSSGKLQKQLEQQDQKKYEAQRGSTKSRYDNKMRNMANERRTSRSCNYCDDRNRDRGYKTSHDSDHKHNKSERKAPPEFLGKPCHVHGDKAKHTYEECRITPKIASRGAAIATTTTESASMMCTITTNATSVAKMSLRKSIARRNRATMRERN